MKLTVIFRDDSPMMYCNDSPTHRSVQVELTPEQEAKLACRVTGRSNGREILEAISMCFIEPDAQVQP